MAKRRKPVEPFHTLLRAARTERGLTVKALAAQLEVSYVHLYAIERGKDKMSLRLAYKVLEIFKMIPVDARDFMRALAWVRWPEAMELFESDFMQPSEEEQQQESYVRGCEDTLNDIQLVIRKKTQALSHE